MSAAYQLTAMSSPRQQAASSSTSYICASLTELGSAEPVEAGGKLNQIAKE